MADKIRITQTHSVIDRDKRQKATISALGLGRPNYYADHNDTPQIRGMVDRVKHLVKVEKLTEEMIAADKAVKDNGPKMVKAASKKSSKKSTTKKETVSKKEETETNEESES